MKVLQMGKQSHYREDPRWGVLNGTIHNWKCFLAYEKLKHIFKTIIYYSNIKMCRKLCRFIWAHDGFIGQPILKL